MKTCVPDGVILDEIAGLWRCKYCPSRNYFSKTTDWADPKGKWNLHGVNCEYYLEMVNSPTKRNNSCSPLNMSTSLDNAVLLASLYSTTCAALRLLTLSDDGSCLHHVQH